MCSSQPWPLLWQRALNRWMVHLFCFHTKSSRYYGRAWEVFGLDVNINTRIRQKEKDKKTFCSACMCYGYAWTFCTDEEVCLFLCTEGNLFCFRKWQWMEFACDNVTILEAWNVASSQLMEYVVVECWLVVQQRCKVRGPRTLTYAYPILVILQLSIPFGLRRERVNAIRPSKQQ